MSNRSEPTRLIAVAANAALLPLNCRRAGQSRRWYSDQRYWVISIEFQPSGWSKGSYLNIGAKWLWSPGPGIDLSYRPVDFIPFESADQFNPLMAGLAARAAEEVQALRERFHSFARIRAFIDQISHIEGWPCFHAAIAAGLDGDIIRARALFERIAEWPTHNYDWEQRLKQRSEQLSRFVENYDDFRAEVQRTIDEGRKRIGLCSDLRTLEGIDS